MDGADGGAEVDAGVATTDERGVVAGAGVVCAGVSDDNGGSRPWRGSL